MSEPPPILPYSVPVPPPPPRVGASVAWLLIVLTVGYMLAAAILPSIRGRVPSTEDPADMQLAMMTKYLIGVRSFVNYPADDLVLQIDAAAKTPLQKLHAALFAGELQGSNVALERLAALETQAQSLKPDIETFQAIYIDGPDTLEPEARTDLLERHGYFAQLALSHGKSDSDPARKKLIADSLFAAAALLAFVAIVGLAGIAGFILLIIAIVLYSDGSLRPAYAAPTTNAGVYVEVFAVWLVSFVLFSIILALALGGSVALGWSWLVSVAVPIALLWGTIRGVSWPEMRNALGWHSGRGVIIEVPLGIIGYIAGLPVVALGFGITFLLIKLSGATPQHPVQGAGTDSVPSVLLLYSVACIWAPVIEETMFRGALYSHLRARFGWVMSALIVGLIFAAIHPQGWTFIPVLGAIGFVLAALREWRGSLIAPMTAHALSNFVMISLLVALK